MIWETGNRCGHKRGSPRLRLAFEPRNRRPPQIRQALGRAERFFHRRGNLFRRSGISYARSEAAEAIVLVVKALLLVWDPVTSRVGWSRGDGYLAGLSVATIARWANINVGRAQRAICTLMHAGLLQGTQPREQLEDGRWIAMPKVRRISWRLFFLLGYTENDLRQWAESALTRRRARDAGEQAKRDAASRAKLGADQVGARVDEPRAIGDVLAHLASHNAAQLERLGRELATGPPDDD